MAKRSSPLKDAAQKLVRDSVPPEKEKVELPEGFELPPWAIDASGNSLMTDDEVAFWIKASGWTPIEFLTTVYRNGYQRMEHRISAAKAVLEYAHKKLPAKLEVSGDLGTKSITLDAVALSKLTDKELEVMTKMLEKLS